MSGDLTQFSSSLKTASSGATDYNALTSSVWKLRYRVFRSRSATTTVAHNLSISRLFWLVAPKLI